MSNLTYTVEAFTAFTKIKSAEVNANFDEIQTKFNNPNQINRSAVEYGTADHVVINGASGELSSEAALAVSRGGTGLASPGTSGNVLTSNGSIWTSSTPAAAPTSSDDLKNLGLSTSVGASALTIALKQSDGSTDPSTGASAVRVGFRDSTATTGAYSTVLVTSALSLTISSGSTLGHASGEDEYIYVYLINNAGTAELAASTSRIWDNGSLISTTAEGGAGAADSRTAIYSSSTRSNVACRLIGRLKSNQATAGTWATGMSEVSLFTSHQPETPSSEVLVTGGNGLGSDTNNKIRRFSATTTNTGSAITYADSTTAGATFTINQEGLYGMSVHDYSATGNSIAGITLNSGNLTTSIISLTGTEVVTLGWAATATIASASCQLRLSPGDVIRVHGDGNNGNSQGDPYVRFRISRLAD